MNEIAQTLTALGILAPLQIFLGGILGITVVVYLLRKL